MAPRGLPLVAVTSMSCLAAVFALSSCPVEPFSPDPNFVLVDFTPAFFCTGETVTMSTKTIRYDGEFVVTDEFEFAELRTKDRHILATIYPGQESVETIPLECGWEEMLELHVRVEKETYVRNVYGLHCIDFPTWLEFESGGELLDERRKSLVLVGYVRIEVPLDDGGFGALVIDVPRYEVYRESEGFVWSQEHLGLADRASVLGMRNTGDYGLHFTVTSSAGAFRKYLGPGEQVTFPTPADAGVHIEGRLEIPQLRLYGHQTGEKPGDVGYSETVRYYRVVHPIELEVRCANAGAIE